MRVTMWIMFIVGLVERTAKKFLGISRRLPAIGHG